MVFDFHSSSSNSPKLVSTGTVPYISHCVYLWPLKHLTVAMLKSQTMALLFNFEPKPNLSCEKIYLPLPMGIFLV